MRVVGERKGSGGGIFPVSLAVNDPLPHNLEMLEAFDCGLPVTRRDRQKIVWFRCDVM